MASYPQAVLDEIRSAVDIVDLVGRFVRLRKAGAGWKGLCPFHAEKTPSFTVNPTRGIFHCFGCGVGGDVFGFVMRQDRLSFPEAVRQLAKSAGVALPE
ncbi:MAG: DNA primase, partial [Candidatus Rokubacteria bacterium]|nr:DNA primase [Candidatus Rokubacteria bacterium]